MKRILSIDGGGIRGIIPALLLAAIERITKRHVADLFDMIAGTSTGGILALGLVKPSGNGTPQYTASSLATLYSQQGARIFKRSRMPLKNLWGPKYASDGIESVLAEYFGDAQLSDAIKPVLVTAADNERRKPFFFRSEEAKTDPTEQFLMRDAARATSAAPTFFAPHYLENSSRPRPLSLIDGGVHSNHPGMAALVDAHAMWPGEEYFMVSLGTGQQTKQIAHQDAAKWGLVGWAPNIMDTVLDGGPQTVDYQLRVILNGNGRQRYHRMQLTLMPEHAAMDDASARNLHALELLADDFIDANRERIEQVCEVLAA